MSLVRLLGSHTMARVVPGSGSAVRQFQGCWMTGIAQRNVLQVTRPMTSLSAFLGGSGGGGAIGGGRNGLGGGGSESGPSGEGRGDRWGRAVGLAVAGGVLLCGEGAAWAAKKQEPPPVAKPSEELTVEKVTDIMWNLAGPILTNLGFSGCVGAAAGYALKKVGQFVAVCVGLAFLFIQGLAYTGFITVNWSHVHNTVTQALDVNKDGKVDAEDFKPLVSKGLAALSQGVPSAGGFLAGFLLALKSF